MRAQMHTELKNSKRLKELYHRALTIKSAIPHPRILGVIRECGGKMHMHERSWSEAATDFFEVRPSWVAELPVEHRAVRRPKTGRAVRLTRSSAVMFPSSSVWQVDYMCVAICDLSLMSGVAA